MLNIRNWYEEGKIHETLSGYVVRSKSEVIIANLLTDRGIPFIYEEPLFAPDGTFYLPDFTITWQGEHFCWEPAGESWDEHRYRDHTDTKRQWYTRFFPDRLVETMEGNDITTQTTELIAKRFS